MALAVIGMIGTAGGTGCTIEFTGDTVQRLSMEGRMTLCNMAIEAGARAGLVAVDDATIDYLRGRTYAPVGDVWDQAVADWRQMVSDPGAVFDHEVAVDAATLRPQVTWGTSPEMVTSVNGQVPYPDEQGDASQAGGMGAGFAVHGFSSRNTHY